MGTPYGTEGKFGANAIVRMATTPSCFMQPMGQKALASCPERNAEGLAGAPFSSRVRFPPVALGISKRFRVHTSYAESV
jgi:hypothetical protein